MPMLIAMTAATASAAALLFIDAILLEMLRFRAFH
jgi:hypothetical protein